MDKKEEIKALREQGCTIRDISQITGIPRSTVHRILKSRQDKYVDIECQGQNRLIFHFPFTYFCPECGKEQRHAWLCPLCGKFIPVECDKDNCCWEGFDLSEVKRKHY